MTIRPIRAALAVFALSAGTAALAAQPTTTSVGRIVAFGDSYADIGNVKAILNGAGLGALYPQAEYPTGRFSGGTNFVDTIAAAYGVGQVNYAIGGAQAGTGNVAAQGLLPGFQQQWVAFTQGGSTYTNVALTYPLYASGTQITIPSGGNRFAADDVAVFSIGGNDARPYRISGTLAGAPAAADAAAANATTGLDALVSRGIRRMVFTVGDVGQLAEAQGQANAAVGTAFSVEYNSKMQATLSRYAAAGVQVAYVDITQVAYVARANLARLGFKDITSACPAACIGNPDLQKQYVFYVDGLHLTSAAFALVGAYAVNILQAPYSYRANGDLPHLAAQGFATTLTARADLARARPAKDGLALFGQFDADHDHRDADAGANGYSYDSRGASGGVEYRAGTTAAGLVGSWARNHADGIDQDRARGHSYQIGGYAVADAQNIVVEGYVGYGWHHLDIRRTGVIDPYTAHPHATSFVAGGRVGYLMPYGALRVGPVIGLDYVRSTLRGYTEQGDEAGSQIVGRQKIGTLAGTAGAEARYQVTPAIAPWVRVSAVKSLDDDGRTLDYAPVVAPTIVDSLVIPGGSHKVYGAATGGLSAMLTRGISLDLAGHASFARDEGNEVGGTAGLRLAF